MEKENFKTPGYIWLPYIPINVKTTINDEAVWYRNKWKNLFLKIRHFFIKPKYLKNVELYKNKKINPANYNTIKITGHE